MGMKLSISLSRKEADFLDSYVRDSGASSRSEAVRRALDLLREAQMEHAYAAAWQEWEAGEDGHLWDRTSGDGLSDASR